MFFHMGRPTSFKPEYADQAERLCRLFPATDDELAAFFDVSRATINNWKNAHPEFLDALKTGKVGSDIAVSDALYDRATGAEWVEDQAFKVRRVEYENGRRKSEVEEVVVVQVRKRAAPDTTAAIFWLKNRQSTHWRDKHEVSGPDGGPLEVLVRETVVDPKNRIAKALGNGSSGNGRAEH